MYGIFGFKYAIGLSTKPDNALGEESIWEQAEKGLKEGLTKFGKPYKIKEKDGAFYGPKIDIEL